MCPCHVLLSYRKPEEQTASGKRHPKGNISASRHPKGNIKSLRRCLPAKAPSVTFQQPQESSPPSVPSPWSSRWLPPMCSLGIPLSIIPLPGIQRMRQKQLGCVLVLCPPLKGQAAQNQTHSHQNLFLYKSEGMSGGRKDKETEGKEGRGEGKEGGRERRRGNKLPVVATSHIFG